VGKVLGAIIGLMAGLLLANVAWAVGLAVLGLIAGHLVFDRTPSVPRSEIPPSTEDLLNRPRPKRHPLPARRPRDTLEDEAPLVTPEEDRLAKGLSPLLVEVARVDGPVTQDEVRVARQLYQGLLGFGPGGMELVRLELKAAIAAAPRDVVELVKAVRGEVKPALRPDVVRALYDIALADGSLQRSEQDLLKRVVQHFNLSDEQLKQITTELFGGGAEHYQLLGLDEAASDEEIKSAFRRLAAENHPDRVASLGPQEAQAAGERFREIKEAYEALRRLRGF